MSQLYKQSIFQKYMDYSSNTFSEIGNVGLDIIRQRRERRDNFLSVFASITEKTMNFGVAHDAVKCKWTEPGMVGLHLAVLIAQHENERTCEQLLLLSDIIKKVSNAKKKV